MAPSLERIANLREDFTRLPVNKGLRDPVQEKRYQEKYEATFGSIYDAIAELQNPIELFVYLTDKLDLISRLEQFKDLRFTALNQTIRDLRCNLAMTARSSFSVATEESSSLLFELERRLRLWAVEAPVHALPAVEHSDAPTSHSPSRSIEDKIAIAIAAKSADHGLSIKKAAQIAGLESYSFLYRSRPWRETCRRIQELKSDAQERSAQPTFD